MKKYSLWAVFLGGGICLSAFVRPVYSEDKNHVENWHDQIVSLWKSDKKNEAEAMLKKWMSRAKKSPDPWILAAEFQFEKKHFKKCKSLAQTALDKSSNAADAFYWKARALEALKNPMDAANELQAALLAKTTKPDAKELLDQWLNQMDSASTSGKK